MSTSNAAGERVAAAIGVIKWILITLVIVAAGVVVVQGVRATADASDENRSQFAGIAILGVIAGAIVVVLFIWVVFGWFQHTLEALNTIAQNTAPDQRPAYQEPAYQGPPPNPQTFNAPPPQYNQPPR